MGVVFNFVVEKKDNTNYCMICDCDISGLVAEHLEGKRHKASFEQHGRHLVRPGVTHVYSCKCCGCKICGWSIVYKHLIGKRHTTLLNKIDESLATCKGLAWNFVVKKFDNSRYCCICDCALTGPSPEQEHLAGTRHAESLKFYQKDVVLVKNNFHYCCRLCRCKFYGYSNVFPHIKGRRHQGLMDQN